MTLQQLEKVKAISVILSSIAVPIVLAAIGWAVQRSLADEGIKKDYVQMALGILRDADRKPDDDLRQWALRVIDKSSPIPFSKDLQEKLKHGDVRLVTFPLPPPLMMAPPVPRKGLPTGRPLTNGDLVETFLDNVRTCDENAIRFSALQDVIWSQKGVVEGRPDGELRAERAKMEALWSERIKEQIEKTNKK